MKEFSSYINEIGRPYGWAQRLAGLQYLEALPNSDRPSAAISSSHIAETVKALRRRVQARLALQKQMAGFGKLIHNIFYKSVAGDVKHTL